MRLLHSPSRRVRANVSHGMLGLHPISAESSWEGARHVARLAGLEAGDPRDGAADVEAVAQQRVRLAVALNRAVLRRERRRVGVL